MRLRATVPLCLSAIAGACTHPCSTELSTSAEPPNAATDSSDSQPFGGRPDSRRANAAAWVLRSNGQPGKYLICPIRHPRIERNPVADGVYLVDLQEGDTAAAEYSGCVPAILAQRVNNNSASAQTGILSALPLNLPFDADFGPEGLLSVELSPPRCRVLPGQSAASRSWPGFAVLTPFVKVRIGDTPTRSEPDG